MRVYSIESLVSFCCVSEASWLVHHTPESSGVSDDEIRHMICDEMTTRIQKANSEDLSSRIEKMEHGLSTMISSRLGGDIMV